MIVDDLELIKRTKSTFFDRELLIFFVNLNSI